MATTSRRGASQQAATEFEGLARARSNWGALALVLLEVERTESWREQYASFTAYIRAAAKSLGIQESVLWRTVSAGRFYLMLGQTYDGVPLPPIVEVASVTGTERLELIEKIARFAPRSVVAELLSNALTGNLSRERVRDVWRVYRPVAAGATARGGRLRGRPGLRSLSVPKGPLVRRGSALYALLEADSTWLSGKAPAAYRVFTDPPLAVGISLHNDQETSAIVTPDIIAVVRPTRESPCVFHLIEFISRIATERSRNLSQRFYQWLPYVDFAWALIEHDPSRTAEGVPKSVGVLCSDGGRVKVIRRATRHPKAGEKTGETAKLLLGELI